MIRKCYLFIYSVVLLCFTSLFFSTPILSAQPLAAIDPIPFEGKNAEGIVVDCGFPGQDATGSQPEGCKMFVPSRMNTSDNISVSWAVRRAGFEPA